MSRTVLAPIEHFNTLRHRTRAWLSLPRSGRLLLGLMQRDISGVSLANSILVLGLLGLALADIVWNARTEIKWFWFGLVALVLGGILHLVFFKLAQADYRREHDEIERQRARREERDA